MAVEDLAGPALLFLLWGLGLVGGVEQGHLELGA